jgi:hypothetical protein
VFKVLTAFAIEGQEAETVSNEFIGEDRGIRDNIDQVDADSRYFGEHDSAQGVCHSEGGAL